MSKNTWNESAESTLKLPLAMRTCFCFLNPNVPVNTVGFLALDRNKRSPSSALSFILALWSPLLLLFFPSQTVQILEESAVGARGLELQPRGQVYPVLLLQKHCPLHHRGRSKLFTESRHAVTHQTFRRHIASHQRVSP